MARFNGASYKTSRSNGQLLNYKVSKAAVQYLSQGNAVSTQGATATLNGNGSVAVSGTIPQAYTVASCNMHGKPLGNAQLLGGLMRVIGYVPPYLPTLHNGPINSTLSYPNGTPIPTGFTGPTHLYCLQCCTWCLVHGHQSYVPKPATAPLTATQQANYNAAVANAQANNTPKPPKPQSYTQGVRKTTSGNAASNKPTYNGNAKSVPWWRKV